MYLTKRTYVWDKDRKGIVIKGTGLENIKANRVQEIVESVGYWRKANAIHKWFVDNVQDGEDNCADYYVSREQLKELLKIVKTVLRHSKLVKGNIENGYRFENGKQVPIIEEGLIIEDSTKAIELLPASEGFFFGSTDYNEYYIEDLKTTRKILEQILKEKDGGDFYYHSSW